MRLSAGGTMAFLIASAKSQNGTASVGDTFHMALSSRLR